MSDLGTIQARVNETLDNGVQNEPKLTEWSDEEIAADLCNYNPGFEGNDPKNLVKYVRQWKKLKAAGARP